MRVVLFISTLCLAILSNAEANPIYPAYADFAPIVLPGAYGVAPYPILAGGGYFGPPVQHHSGGYRGQAGYSEKTIEYQKDSKYYYGGQYKGSCLEDGLYYKDDTTFIMCSNGYPHVQPCPPGTKTSGSPAYKPGYYYGYTDLCSVNLVDYGLGPEHYAPAGPPEDEKSSYSRGVSSSRVSYAGNAAYGSAEKHVSKDVTTNHQRGHHGQQHHAHLEKHKVEQNYGGGAGYDKHVVKQGSVTSYNDVTGGHHAHYEGYAPPYGDTAVVSQQSYHKEKHETSGPGYHHSPVGAHTNIHSEHIVKSHHGSGLEHHHQDVRGRTEHHYVDKSSYQDPHGYGSYDGAHAGYKAAESISGKVVTSEYQHGEGGHHVEKFREESSVNKGGYSGGHYPHPGGQVHGKPIPYQY